MHTFTYTLTTNKPVSLACTQHKFTSKKTLYMDKHAQIMTYHEDTLHWTLTVTHMITVTVTVTVTVTLPLLIPNNGEVHLTHR